MELRRSRRVEAWPSDIDLVGPAVESEPHGLVGGLAVEVVDQAHNLLLSHGTTTHAIRELNLTDAQLRYRYREHLRSVRVITDDPLRVREMIAVRELVHELLGGDAIRA